MDSRNEKIEQQLVSLAAQFFNRESNRTSMITVTRSLLFSRGSRATIFITVFPESDEESALNFAKRKRTDLKDYIRKNTRIGNIPQLEIEIDQGDKNRRAIEDISQQENNSK